MSKTADQADGNVVQDFLSVADLLEDPQLARVYAYLAREGQATVKTLMEALDLPQGTAYTYVDRLESTGVITATTDDQPHTYAAVEIDLTITTADSEREYRITPALVDAVSQRPSDDDIDAYVDRHGVAGLATALTYAVARERGDVTHRLMAADLDISPLEAEVILQALRPVVHAYHDLDEPGASLADLDETANRDADSDDL